MRNTDRIFIPCNNPNSFKRFSQQLYLMLHRLSVSKHCYMEIGYSSLCKFNPSHSSIRSVEMFIISRYLLVN